MLLPLRLLRPTQSKHLVLRILPRQLVNPLPILAVFVLNYLRSGTSLLMAKCTAGTVRVVWFTRMARWPILPATLTPLTHKVAKCINHVSSDMPPLLYSYAVQPELGNHAKENMLKRLLRIRPWGFLSCIFPFLFASGILADR